ncbi:MAG: amidohydrolase family protein [Immundisolibacterales bacterium]|nr:amidohydrolase family protein [Immundisolibacterales bacterium]
MNQLVIRGATVVDGLGNEPVRADVAVRDGRIGEVGAVRESAEREIDAGGLTLAPGFVDLHTHYDAQITWDRTLSPSPSLGVTTVVMGNCGFGIVPAAPPVRDLILRNLSVVEGMDLEALRAGVRWEFETFGEYLAALRAIAPAANVAVLAGHSVIRTTVMGEAASERAEATPDELARMKALVAEAMDGGAIGLGASYSLNHSGYGGVPMPSTITDLSEFDALVGAMGSRPAGIVQLASGAKTVEEIEAVAGRHGRAVFKGTGAAMYNEQAPERSIGMFEACRAAQARGNPVYIQIPCQPLSFDFTLANAYPFFSHDAFSEVKAYGRERLVPYFGSREFRDRFRASLANPRPGLIFQGNWDRVVVAVPALAKNDGLADRTIADIAAERGADPLDTMFDLGLEENLETMFIGQFLNVGDEGVARLLKHEAGVVALSDAGAHLTFMCEAGYGLHFLSHWVRELGEFDIADGVRRLTSHPADLYGIPDRGRIETGAWADLLLFDPETVGVTASERVADLPGGGRRTIRRPLGIHGVFCNGVEVFDGSDYVTNGRGPGQVLDRFAPSSALRRENGGAAQG